MPKAAKLNSSIYSRAILVDVDCSTWSFHTGEVDNTEDVILRNKAERGAFSGKKALVPSDEIQAFRLTVGHIRTFIKKHTLPWSDSGYRMLPLTSYQSFRKTLVELIGEFDAAADDFCNRLPMIKKRCKESFLGKMYDDADYPDATAIRNRFKIKVKWANIPDTDLRIKMADDEAKELRQDLEKTAACIQSVALKDLFNRMLEPIKKLGEKLTEEADPANIRANTIESIAKMVEISKELNIFDSEAVTKLCSEMEKLSSISAQDLRDSVDDRKETRAKVEAIMKKFDGII